MTNSRLAARIFPALSLPSGAIQIWKQLQSSHGHLQSPFYSYEYASMMASVHPHVFVCVIEREGEIAGFLPFQYATALQRCLAAAERVGGEMTDYFGLIAGPAMHSAPTDLLRLAGIKHFYFTHLPEAQLQYGLEGERPEVGLLVDIKTAQGTYWEQRRNQDKKFVLDTERRARKLQTEYGALRFCLEEADWPSALDMLIERKRAQYQATGVQDCLQEHWKRNLLRQLAASPSDSCRAILSTLWAGDLWVASQVSLKGDHVLHAWFPVYNRELHQYAPGRLLLKNIIEAAPSLGITVIDRGVGDTKAKRDFATREQLFYRGAWRLPGLRSLVYRASCSVKWRLARGVSRTAPLPGELQNA